MIKWVVSDILVKCSCKINIYLFVIYIVIANVYYETYQQHKKSHYYIIDIANLLTSP